jgi:two-component system, OmpR family, response regulator
VPRRRLGGAALRALVIEDDAVVRDALVAALEDSSYHVQAEATGVDADKVVDRFRPDIVLLDVGLPDGIDGFTVGRRIRRINDLPILYITGAAGLDDRLEGFRVGADDYVTKPFLMPELLARVEAVLRRTGRLERAVWTVGDIVIDEEAHTVTVNGHPVALTAIEFALLATLARRPGRTMSKVQLLTEVWGYDHYGLNVVEVHVSALRKKLEAHGPRVVHTVRSIGYVLRA